MILTVKRTLQASFTFMLSGVLALSMAVVPTTSYAETSAELRAQADEKQAQADEISARIDELSTQMAQAREVEDEAMEKYDAAEAAKQDAITRKEAAEKIIAETQTRLSARVTSMYRNGGATTFLDVLLGANSFEEFLTNWDALAAINNQDAELVEQNRTARAEAAAAAEEYEQQSKVAQEELERAQAASQEIAEASSALANELASMNEEIAELIAQEEQAAAEEEEARQRAEAAAAASSSSSSSSSTWTDPGTGGEPFDSSYFDGWVKPTSYYGVTCEFGYSPITGSHNGIDLGASSGTPIYSSGPGTVTFVGWYGTGGNAVIVDHGNGVQTIYMHQSQTAAYVGESVEAGTCIGYVGSTGLSTGPHLHFQLVINGTPTNPRNYFTF